MNARRICFIAALLLSSHLVACESGADDDTEAEAADPQVEAVEGYVEAPLKPLDSRGWAIELPEGYAASDDGRSFEDSAGHGPEFEIKSRGSVDSTDALEARVRDLKVRGKQRQKIERDGDKIGRLVSSPSGNLQVEVHRVIDGKAVACKAKLRVDEKKPLIEAMVALADRACATVSPAASDTAAAR